MTKHREEGARIVVGDCVEAMREMAESSVDAMVTDPPYLIGFMGKAFDSQHKTFVERKSNRRAGSFEAEHGNHNPTDSLDQVRTRLAEGRRAQAWHEAWATEALRVLKPGGHLLAFGGTRTHHRLACAVEDAGFEIRDSLIWLYGSGFPKSLDVSKAIDKAAGVEREVTGRNPNARGDNREPESGWRRPFMADPDADSKLVTAPATPEAEKWNGWGTALKPGHEPIVMARKPLIGTVAANVQAHGTGALNIDGCRIGTSKDVPASPARKAEGTALSGSVDGSLRRCDGTEDGFNPDVGRWPANVLLDEAAAAELDRQSGESKSRIGRPREGANGDGWGMKSTGAEYDDEGGPSRYFYCAKASRAERNAGLGGFEERMPDNAVDRAAQLSLPRANVHPTVKPIALMRWLCRLVTPEGGTVLDPFTGSGTTGAAAILEGVGFIGIEREAEYAELAEARIQWWAQHQGREADEVLEESRRSESERERMEAMGQMGLL